MTTLPHDPKLDSTFALLSEGYEFISNRCEQLQADAFETRLMLRKVVCARGEDAARMFYEDADRFTRVGAMPPTTLMLLQDKGSVQVLDGEAHRRRKQMFMSLMTAERRRQLASLFEARWQERIPQWEDMDEVALHGEVQELLCGAVCEWVGVPLTEAAVRQRTQEFSAMIDGAGAFGLRNWKGMLLRSRTEDWARHFIRSIRSGHVAVPRDCPAQAIATFQDADGELLDVAEAAVELLNLLRPTVAVARFITFAALALHDHPECKEHLHADDDNYLQCFVQEVRRFYPFFPVVGGRVRKEFEWHGTQFTPETWVLLDLYGTNHDARIWGDPRSFRPERFRDWDGNRFDFIPQGGGDFDLGHRCAGEWITIELMKTAVKQLVTAMEYAVPVQDLRVDLSKMPTLPESGFIISNIHPVHAPIPRQRALVQSGARAQ